MFNLNDPHQFFELYDDDDVLTCRWTMDKMQRQDGEVWVMNHLFINPQADSNKILTEEMEFILEIAQETKTPIWPLDPMVIDYFNKHDEFSKIWYHKPATS
ncbi:hypothetical protein [Lactobacillus sp. ESL0681]|uniref:hypothetical protein n=1 Tax=Lactobacillus sp. ESL0681 TaxID=2983211 RepID=UPI0023F69C43|nr:hypothetical protein [Lactobacillus sp. ESL0681]WEV41059.1 hypothetical protein OZX59_03835 [Lactobacillus sp. ESL0681]